MRNILLVLVLSIFNQVIAQDFKSLTSSGSMPIALSRAVDNSTQTKEGKAFNDEIAFVIKTLLRSGRLVYGDSISAYLNECGDLIYDKNPDIDVAVDFFVLKNTTPNAFALPNGIILVTTGLLGQVESEAQLLFILSHEIAHVKRKHGWERFQEKVDILKGKGDFKGLSFDERINLALKKSRKHELEADELGFEYYKNLKLNNIQVLRTFDMLLYSYLPFDEREFDYSFFEDSFYVFPNKFKDFTRNDIDVSEYEDDDESTHPNVEKRKANIVESFSDTGTSKLYALSQKRFSRVQFIARHENTTLHIVNGALDKALYNAFLLKEYYGNSRFVHRVKAYVTVNYCISKFSENMVSSDFRMSTKKVQGNTQSVTELFYKMKQKDALMLAKRCLLEGLQTGSDSMFYSKIQQQMDKLTKKKWSNISKSLILDKSKAKGIDIFSGSSKVDRLKRGNQNGKSIDSSKYYNWAFLGLKPTAEQRLWLNIGSQRYLILDDDDDDDDELEDEDDDELEDLNDDDGLESADSEAQPEEIVILYPTIVRLIETRRTVKRDKFSDEKVASTIGEEAEKFGESLNLNVTFSDAATLNTTSAFDYNRMSYYNLWQTSNRRLYGELAPFLSFDSAYVDIANSNVAISDMLVISTKSNRPLELIHLLIMVSYPYSIPYYVVHFLTKENLTYLRVNIYNVGTGKLISTSKVYYQAAGSGDYLKSHLYSILYNYTKSK